MFEQIDDKYVIKPTNKTIVSGKRFLETYAAKNFSKIIQDQSENIRIRAHDELKDVEKLLLEEYAVKKVK